MNTPDERARLLASCEDLAQRGEWPQLHVICEQVTSQGTCSQVERAHWMLRWAAWIWRESLTHGRSLGFAIGLLADAIPLAKTDHRLLAKILVAQTAMLTGDDVERAARRFWALLAKNPDLEQYRGQVLHNMGLAYSFCGQPEKAARYYRRATLVLSDRQPEWAYRAYHNLAEVLLQLGHYRAAEVATQKAKPEAPEDRCMYASLRAYLAVVRGLPACALALVEEGLTDPACTPLARAHLWYYQALALQQMGAYEQAGEVLERTWPYASERNLVWICDGLTRLQAELNSRKGVS